MAAAFCSGVLIGASGYAMYLMNAMECPYAFSTCTIGLCHGLILAIEAFKEGEENNRAREVSTSCLQFITIPLVNVDIYLHSSESSFLALGHCLFILPFWYEIMVGTDTGEGGGEEEGGDGGTNYDSIKQLAILGSVMSLVFIAVNEHNNLFAGMAVAAFCANYGAQLINEQSDGAGCHVTIWSHAIFNLLTGYHNPKS